MGKVEWNKVQDEVTGDSSRVEMLGVGIGKEEDDADLQVEVVVMSAHCLVEEVLAPEGAHSLDGSWGLRLVVRELGGPHA